MRKGWCPGALRPMPAKDGLLARLRIRGSTLTSGTLRRIAAAGRTHGNGLFDLTSRANLQMRGVTEWSLASLLAELEPHGLLDETVAAESIRNVLVSPLAGLGAALDVRRVAATLETMLVEDKALHGLPAKFGFLIDDRSALSLASVPADVRFTSIEGTGAFSIALGGNGHDAVPVGRCATGRLVPVASALAHAFLSLGATLPEKPARMRDLLRALEPRAITAAAGLPFEPHTEPIDGECLDPSPIGLVDTPCAQRKCFGAGTPFGRLDASMLEAVAEAAENFGAGEIRLTPWRAMLFPLVSESCGGDLARFLGARGFITSTTDAHLAVAACGGRASCERATTDTRTDASSLAVLARNLGSSGITLHVSGCVKGCARPVSAPYTLIGNNGRYDLVVDGPSGETCVASGLTLPRAKEMLEGFAQMKDLIQQ